MDELDRIFRRLVEVVRAEHPSLIDRPIEVGELYQSVLPYRHHRRELGFDSNQDYELAMMRLLAGERGYVRGDSRMQERLRQELSSKNPDTALFRGFSTTTVTLDPEAVARATGGELVAGRERSIEPRPMADQPVAQRVADDRVPPERPRPATPMPPAPPPIGPMGPAASSPDAETIVFRRTPAVGPMPPMPPVMSPPPPMPSAAQSAAPAAGDAPRADATRGDAAAAAHPSEPILLRSNETLTIRPGGEVVSSLGEPASAVPSAASAAAAPAATAPPPATPLPSVGPPPRPRPAPTASAPAPSMDSRPVTADADVAPRRDARADMAAAPTASAPNSTSSRTAMTTPQRGTNTIVASGDCRYCGGVLPDGRRITFCPHCGQNLTIQHCPACSTELELGWKFCTTCGRSVTSAEAAARA